MALDVLSLGPFVFDGFAVPEKLPAGGRQHLVVHKMPGGSRTIDAMGPDDIDRAWSGTMWGAAALSDALTLDALRRSGEPLPYSNGVEARSVVILEFLYEVRKFQCVEYSIILTPTDSYGGGGTGFAIGFGFGGIESLVSADLGIVDGIVSDAVGGAVNSIVGGALSGLSL